MSEREALKTRMDNHEAMVATETEAYEQKPNKTKTRENDMP